MSEINVFPRGPNEVSIEIAPVGLKGDRGIPGIDGVSPSTADLDQAIAMTEGYRDNALAAAASAEAYGKPYASRAAFEAANIPANVTRAAYFSAPSPVVGRRALTVCLSDVPGCAATNGGVKFWQPDGDVTPNHWADNATPGTTDMAPATQLAVDYAALSGAPGAATSPGPKDVLFIDAEYRFNSTVKLLAGYDHVRLKTASASKILSAVTNGPAIQINEDAQFSGLDTAGIASIQGVHIEGLRFVAESSTSQANVAIRSGGAPDLKILHCDFFNFWVSLDWHRQNTPEVTGCRFSATARRVAAPALAHIRMQGVISTASPTSTGGSAHLTDNVFLGSSSDYEALANCLLVHTVDGLYLTQNYFNFVSKAHIEFRPFNTPQNNTITDVISGGGNYFDGQNGANVRNVDLTGTVNGNFKNIRFQNDFFRGGGTSRWAITASVLDGNNFVTNRGGITGFAVTDCLFGEFTDAAIILNGATLGYVPLVTPIINSNRFYGGNSGGVVGIGASYIDADVNGISCNHNVFAAEVFAPARAVAINTTSYANAAVTFTNNDISKTIAATDAYRVLRGADAITNIGPNLTPTGRVNENASEVEPVEALAARDEAVAAATQAAAAALTAATARDGTFAAGDTYATITAGRAAVLDGAQFTVVEAGATEAVRYVRTGASTQTEVARYPVASTVFANTLSSGNILARSTVTGTGANGGTFTAATATISIPAASTGNNSGMIARMPLDADDLALLTGRTIIMRAVYEATAGFIAAHPPSGSIAGAAYRPTSETLVGTTIRSEQVGTRIVREVEYVVTAADATIGVYYFCTGGVTGTDHALTLIGTSYRIKADALSVDQAADLTLDHLLAKRSSASGAVVVSDILGENGERINGATARIAFGFPLGLATPAGSTGSNSYVRPWYDLDLTGFTGCTVEVAVAITPSAPFTRTFGFSQLGVVLADGTVTTRTLAGSSVTSLPDGTIVKAYQFIALGNERQFRPVVMQAGAAAPTNEHWDITDVSARVVSTDTDFETPTVANMRLARVSALARAAIAARAEIDALGIQTVEAPEADDRIQQRYDAVVTVAPSGADYTTLAAALTAIRVANDANATKVYQVIVGAGVYPQNNTLNGQEQWVPDYVDVVFLPGAVLSYDGPNTGLPANVETINISRASRIYGAAIFAKDARYPIHSETNGQFPNRTQWFDACVVEHLGNADNTAETGVDSWTSTHAFGCGTSSGQIINSVGNVWKSNNSGFYWHNNRDFAAPSQVHQRGDQVGITSGNTAARALSCEILGSGQKDRWIIEGVSTANRLQIRTEKWLSAAPALQVADRYEFDIVGWGNTPFPVEFGPLVAKALRITTLDTASHTISVSGTAADALMGLSRYTSHRAGGGLPGHATGHWNIADDGVGPALDQHITLMGYRLGNCSVTPKTMAVTVNGTSYTVTFNTDLRAATNATILAQINGVIGAVATAAEFDVTATRHPRITDEEVILFSATDGIPRKSALAYDGDYRRVRLMTSADDAMLFAGIALEDIYPGEAGRVKIRGYLHRSFVRGLETHGATFLQGSIVGATPGQLGIAGSQIVMRAMRSDVWRVR